MVQLGYLQGINRLLQKGLDEQETYAAVFAILENAIPFDSATLCAYVPDDDRIEVVYQTGDVSVDLAPEIPLGKGKGISGWITRQKKPIVISSLAKSRPGKEKRFNSFLSLPLFAAGRLIGVLNLGHMQAGKYREAEIEAYQAIAAEISIVIDRFRLQADLKRQNQELQKKLEQIHQLQKELVEKERLAAIGEVVITVNHEINNPLTTIMGLAEILELTLATASTEKIREGLKGIIRETDCIRRVTHKLANLKNIRTVEYISGQRMISLDEDNGENA